jgi:hypothetical protein
VGVGAFAADLESDLKAMANDNDTRSAFRQIHVFVVVAFIAIIHTQEAWLNARPRKCLDFKTPAEAFPVLRLTLEFTGRKAVRERRGPKGFYSFLFFQLLI